jgi:hypothetical protein
MFADLGALGPFRAMESTDGLADFAFWGRDARRLVRDDDSGSVICAGTEGTGDRTAASRPRRSPAG